MKIVLFFKGFCLAYGFAGVILVLSAFGALAETKTEFSCELLGPGHTPHPDFPYTCCFPGTVPVRGEMRCEKPGESQPVMQKSAPLSSGTSNQQCIAKGQVCVLNGTACCSGTCSSTFPNTYCQ